MTGGQEEFSSQKQQSGQLCEGAQNVQAAGEDQLGTTETFPFRDKPTGWGKMTL